MKNNEKPSDLLVGLLKDHARQWVSKDQALAIIPEVEKLEKEISALRASGWDISVRTIQAPAEVKGGVRLRIITQYMYRPPLAQSGWTCTRCADVYTSVSGVEFGETTIDPRHRQAVCWRCKKKTFWRRIDEQASSGKD